MGAYFKPRPSTRTLILEAFGALEGDPNWNANADLDGSGEVDLLDLNLILENFGMLGEE